MALERDKLTAERALLTLGESELLELYRRMNLIRRFEDRTAEMYARGKITGFCHLYAGEEAVAVGSISPALAEGRAITAAMEGIARQPEAAGSLARTLFVGLAMIETMAIYCLVVALLVLFANPFVH